MYSNRGRHRHVNFVPRFDYGREFLRKLELGKNTLMCLRTDAKPISSNLRYVEIEIKISHPYVLLLLDGFGNCTRDSCVHVLSINTRYL